jgi:hypothetical protein
MNDFVINEGNVNEAIKITLMNIIKALDKYDILDADMEIINHLEKEIN